MLEGADLGAAIREMFETEDKLRCAVAFWGSEYSKLACETGAEVILDISMGCTSKASLEALGVKSKSVSAYAGKHVHILDKLHAKIYLGRNRCILGSANASGNALGRTGSQPKHHEAAIAFERAEHPDAFEQVEALWKKYLGASREITPDDHKRAPHSAATNAARDFEGDPAQETSILQAVLLQPQKFISTTFQFADSEIKPKYFRKANDAFSEKFGVAPEEHGLEHICTADPSDHIDKASRNSVRIIQFWFGEKHGIYAYDGIVRIKHEDSVSYFGHRSWSRVCQAVGLGHLEEASTWKADKEAARRLADLKMEPKGSRFIALAADALCEEMERLAAS